MPATPESAVPYKAESPMAVSGWSLDIASTEGLESRDLGSLLGLIEKGLSAEAESRLRERLELSLTGMASLLGMSPRTLGRRHEEGRLSPEESDRLYRLARLYERAVEVVGSEDAARQWLKKKHLRLGGRMPLDLARYEPGVREVENLLGRVERGIPA